MLRYFLILSILSGIFGHQEYADESQDSSTSYNKTTPKKKKQNKCLRNKYGLKKLENQDVELTYCFEHGPRTCCANEDVVPIRQKMSLVKYTANPKVSDQCFAVTSRVMCSKCDADIGTGVNSEGALCLNFCDEWLFACQNEFIDPYLDVSEHVPFCREDSLVCSPVTDVVKSSRNFCEYMGYKVASTADVVEQQNEKDAFPFIDDDEEQEVKIDKPQEKCFSGFPKQIISLGHMNRTRRYEPKDRMQLLREQIQKFLDASKIEQVLVFLRKNIVPFSGLSVVYAIYQIVMHFYYNSKSSKAARFQNSQTQAQMRVKALEKLRKEKKDEEAAKKKNNKNADDSKSQQTEASVKNNQKEKEDKKADGGNKSSIKKIMEQIRQSRQDRAERQKEKDE